MPLHLLKATAAWRPLFIALSRQGAAVPGGGSCTATQNLRVGGQAQGMYGLLAGLGVPWQHPVSQPARCLLVKGPAHAAVWAVLPVQVGQAAYHVPHVRVFLPPTLPLPSRTTPPPQILDCLDLPPEYRSLLTTDDHETNLHAGANCAGWLFEGACARLDSLGTWAAGCGVQVRLFEGSL